MSSAPIESPIESIEDIRERYHDLGAYDDFSPNHEAPYSALLSFGFHFCLIMVLAFLPDLLKRDHREMPEVVTQAVTDNLATASADTSDANDVDFGESLQNTPETENQPEPDMTPEQTADDLNVTETETDVEEVEQQVQSELGQRLTDAESIRDAAAAAASALKDNLANQTGTGAPSSAGSGGRAGRAARWVLLFNTQSPQAYISQLGQLGAEVAFPMSGDRWKYFTDLNGARGSEVRNLAQEGRIYWMDEESYQGVARLLGVDNAPMMTAFLPIELEEKMLRLELAYQGASEEDIRTTQFRVVPRGGTLDVVVIDQTLK